MAAVSINPRRRCPHSHPLNSLIPMSPPESLMNLPDGLISLPEGPVRRSRGPPISLPKGATFHYPSSRSHDEFLALRPPSPTDHFIPPRLTRSESNPDDVIGACQRRAALFLHRLDGISSLGVDPVRPAEPLSPADSLPTDSDSVMDIDDDALPVPSCFLNLGRMIRERPLQVCAPRPRRVCQVESKKQKHDHASDSGLGASLASTKEQQTSASPVATHVNASVMTRSVATSATMENVSGLSQRASNRIREHILRPLRTKPALKPFEPILADVPRSIREKEIVCLRDLEKMLWFRAQQKTKSASLYLDFCLTALHCIQASVAYLGERDQTRRGDRPYTNGYFVDLREQHLQYAAQLAAMADGESQVKEVKGAKGRVELDLTNEAKLAVLDEQHAALTPTDVDGSVSDAPLIRLKRSLSAGLEDDDEEILRSMARRKKNALIEEPIPRRCTEPGCHREFKRPCDLTKHQKTHLRPFKCRIETCKYHKLGWPTEKELDRHWNDKHSTNPAMYRCRFHPCPYKSKRESNCKQHMEKAHGWVYVRQKTNGKKSISGSAYGSGGGGSGGYPQAAQSLPPVEEVPMFYGALTPPQEDHHPYHHDNDSNDTNNYGHYGQFGAFDFPIYTADPDYLQVQASIPLQLDDMDFEFAAPRQVPQQFDATFGNAFPDAADFMAGGDLYSSVRQLPSPEPCSFAPKGTRVEMPTFEPHNAHAGQAAHCAPYTPPQNHQNSFSPGAKNHAMLYTPTSMRDEDFGFTDAAAFEGAQMTGDFQLFPAGVKTTEQDLLFGDLSSAVLPFSSSHPTQDLFPALVDPLQSSQSSLMFEWTPLQHAPQLAREQHYQQQQHHY